METCAWAPYVQSHGWLGTKMVNGPNAVRTSFKAADWLKSQDLIPVVLGSSVPCNLVVINVAPIIKA